MSKTETQPAKVIQLPNGVLIRPKNIVRVTPLGPDYRDTPNHAQLSEKPYIKIVESNKSEHFVRFKTEEERDALMEELLKQLSL